MITARTTVSYTFLPLLMHACLRCRWLPHRKFSLRPCISASIPFTHISIERITEAWPGLFVSLSILIHDEFAFAYSYARCLFSCQRKQKPQCNRHAVVDGGAIVRCKNFYCIQMVYIFFFFLKGVFFAVVVVCRMPFLSIGKFARLLWWLAVGAQKECSQKKEKFRLFWLCDSDCRRRRRRHRLCVSAADLDAGHLMQAGWSDVGVAKQTAFAFFFLLQME